MRAFYRFVVLLPFVALSACSAGERGMISPHQPLVSPVAATVPGCPDWHDKDITSTDGMSSNYGCADAVNLAAMIADPSDLLHGKSAGANNVEVSVRAIRAWREVAPTSKQWQVTTSTSTKGGN